MKKLLVEAKPCEFALKLKKGNMISKIPFRRKTLLLVLKTQNFIDLKTVEKGAGGKCVQDLII
jgi:hypothetical protein